MTYFKLFPGKVTVVTAGNDYKSDFPGNDYKSDFPGDDIFVSRKSDRSDCGK